MFSNRKKKLADINFLYNTLLERNPENQFVVEKKLELSNYQELLLEFVNSREFKEKMSNSSSNSVDLVLTENELEQLSVRVVQQWTALGNEKPFWSVISDPKFMPAEMAKHSDEFWASGEIAVNQILKKCDSLNLGINKKGIGLELGAGVGRLSFPLSKRINTLLALDVSRGNLSLLQAQQPSHSNIEPILISSFEQFKTFSKIDFFISLITLQHNPPPLQKFILQSIFQSMNVHAVGVFQIPIHTPHFTFNTKAFLNGSTSEMDMFSLPINKIFEICRESKVSIVHVEQDDLAGPKHLSCTFYVQKNLDNSN